MSSWFYKLVLEICLSKNGNWNTCSSHAQLHFRTIPCGYTWLKSHPFHYLTNGSVISRLITSPLVLIGLFILYSPYCLVSFADLINAYEGTTDRIHADRFNSTAPLFASFPHPRISKTTGFSDIVSMLVQLSKHADTSVCIHMNGLRHRYKQNILLLSLPFTYRFHGHLCTCDNISCFAKICKILTGQEIWQYLKSLCYSKSKQFKMYSAKTYRTV